MKTTTACGSGASVQGVAALRGSGAFYCALRLHPPDAPALLKERVHLHHKVPARCKRSARRRQRCCTAHTRLLRFCGPLADVSAYLQRLIKRAARTLHAQQQRRTTARLAERAGGTAVLARDATWELRCCAALLALLCRRLTPRT
jgi:hypothetical protein